MSIDRSFYKQLILVHDYQITLIQNDGLMQTFKLFHYFFICYMSIWTIFTIWILYVVVHTRRIHVNADSDFMTDTGLPIYTDHNTEYTTQLHKALTQKRVRNFRRVYFQTRQFIQIWNHYYLISSTRTLTVTHSFIRFLYIHTE